MKKTFLFSMFSIGLMITFLSGCSSKSSFDQTILSLPDDNSNYYAVGGFEGTWSASLSTAMSPTSIFAISEIDIDVATSLSSKDVKYLYSKEIVISDNAGFNCYAVVNNQKVAFDNTHTIRVIKSVYNEVEDIYTNSYWIPKGTNDYNHAEALTDNIYIPPYQDRKDDFGFNWNDNPVITSESGRYLFVFAEYSNKSTSSVPGYGFAAIKL